MQKSRDLVATNVVLPAADKARLEALSAKTRIRQSEFLREAVRDLLAKYAGALDEDGPRRSSGKRKRSE